MVLFVVSDGVCVCVCVGVEHDGAAETCKNKHTHTRTLSVSLTLNMGVCQMFTATCCEFTRRSCSHTPSHTPSHMQRQAWMCVHMVLFSAPALVFVSQEDMTPIPEVSPSAQCVRVDSRVSADHSQSCTTYSQNDELTYGFLFPPGKPAGRPQDAALFDRSMTFHVMRSYVDNLRPFHRDGIVSGVQI